MIDETAAATRNKRSGIWEDVVKVNNATGSCVLFPMGCIVYFGGLIALIAWGNGILILLLWMFFGGPIVVTLVGLTVIFALMPLSFLAALAGRILGRRD